MMKSSTLPASQNGISQYGDGNGAIAALECAVGRDRRSLGIYSSGIYSLGNPSGNLLENHLPIHNLPIRNLPIQYLFIRYQLGDRMLGDWMLGELLSGEGMPEQRSGRYRCNQVVQSQN